jgi:hypothetical protein
MNIENENFLEFIKVLSEMVQEESLKNQDDLTGSNE